MSQSSMKIALVGEMLSGGGAERVQARLSHFFVNKGIEVHHIIFIDQVSYSFAGTLFNLGALKKPNEGLFGKWKRFKKLQSYIKEQQFDYIIDFRSKHNYLQEWFLNKRVFTAPYIMSVRSNHLDFHFPKQFWLAKLLYGKSHGIVTVSKGITQKIQQKYPYLKVTTIYNPIDIPSVKKLTSEEISIQKPYLLAVGRLHPVKQLDHLLHAYHNSKVALKGVKLVIMGEGKEQNNLERLVQKLNLEAQVAFKNFTDNPFPYYANAYATILTSKYEGFPNVLIESLATGTPVIAYDCETGPNEIIQHQKNGLLVPSQDKGELAEAIRQMAEDSQLYTFCKNNALDSVASFASERIIEEWLHFLENASH